MVQSDSGDATRDSVVRAGRIGAPIIEATVEGDERAFPGACGCKEGELLSARHRKGMNTASLHVDRPPPTGGPVGALFSGGVWVPCQTASDSTCVSS